RSWFPPGSFIEILGRRFPNALDDARVGDGRDGLLDPLNLNLMIPVVAEVEPVTENTSRLQAQVVQLRCPGVSSPFLPPRPVRNPVIGSVRIERPLPELKLVQVLIPAVVGLEDGVMECPRVWSPRISIVRLITLFANSSLVGPPVKKTASTYKFAGGAAS